MFIFILTVLGALLLFLLDLFREGFSDQLVVLAYVGVLHELMIAYRIADLRSDFSCLFHCFLLFFRHDRFCYIVQEFENVINRFAFSHDYVEFL